MSSSPDRRVTVEIKNGNLAMVLATDIQYIGYKGFLRQVYLYSVQIYGVCLQILQTSWKLTLKGLERSLVAACYRHVSDNDDNQTPHHKEHIKVGRPFKLLNLLGWWWYFGEFYTCKHVDCLDTSNEKSRYDYHFIKLTKILHSSSGVRKGEGIIIKFNQMFPYATNSYSCISMLVTLAVTVPITSPGIVLISFVRSHSSPQNSKMVSNRPPG